MMDITDQKKIESQLNIADDNWNRTFDAIPDLVSIHDTNHNILRVNRAFLEAFELDAEEIIGRKCYDLIHKSKSPYAECPFELTKKDFRVHSMEFDHPDLRVPLLVTASPIFDTEGKLIGIVHIAKDISEMRRAKEEVERRIKTLERFHSVSVGRELKMKELKERIRDLEQKLTKDKGQKQ